MSPQGPLSLKAKISDHHRKRNEQITNTMVKEINSKLPNVGKVYQIPIKKKRAESPEVVALSSQSQNPSVMRTKDQLRAMGLQVSQFSKFIPSHTTTDLKNALRMPTGTKMSQNSTQIATQIAQNNITSAQGAINQLRTMGTKVSQNSIQVAQNDVKNAQSAMNHQRSMGNNTLSTQTRIMNSQNRILSVARNTNMAAQNNPKSTKGTQTSPLEGFQTKTTAFASYVDWELAATRARAREWSRLLSEPAPLLKTKDKEARRVVFGMMQG